MGEETFPSQPLTKLKPNLAQSAQLNINIAMQSYKDIKWPQFFLEFIIEIILLNIIRFRWRFEIFFEVSHQLICETVIFSCLFRTSKLINKI